MLVILRGVLGLTYMTKVVSLREISSVACRCSVQYLTSTTTDQSNYETEVSAVSTTVDVVVASISVANAGKLLDTLCDMKPLNQFRNDINDSILNLSHLRRIRGKRKLNSESNEKVVEILICLSSDSQLPEEIQSILDDCTICKKTEVLPVPALPPLCRQEFEEWSKIWPLNYHPSQAERDRERGISSKELQDIESYLLVLQQDNEEASNGAMREAGFPGNGAIMVNPAKKTVVMTSSMAVKYMCFRPKPNCALNTSDGECEFDYSVFCPYIHTPTMLCIDGVAAKVRGDIPDTDGSLPLNAYLCSGLDLYIHNPVVPTTQSEVELDVMSSMALVHSRIRRVFVVTFLNDDSSSSSSSSSSSMDVMKQPHRIHCLPALNHHYRLFKVIARSSSDKISKT